MKFALAFEGRDLNPPLNLCYDCISLLVQEYDKMHIEVAKGYQMICSICLKAKVTLEEANDAA